MKKVLILGALFFSLYGFSQSRDKGTIELTPLVGYATANYYGESNLNNSSVSNVNFGVNGDYFFNNRWSLRSGLLYQAMGTKFSGYEEKLKYLTIPVNANWHFGSTRKWNLNFGPSAGFLLTAEDNMGNDIKDSANTFQLGLNFGIGYKIEISEKFSILIDYQGMAGLTEIAKDSDYTLKNVYDSFNVGAVIKL